MTDPSELKQLEQRLERRRADLLRVIAHEAPQATIDAASARLHAALRELARAGGTGGDSGPEAAALPPTLTGHLFGSGGDGQSLRPATKASLGGPQVGLCLSGGGTRAASCSMGALRALQSLGLLDRVQLLSTVSGGGWAGSIYMYSGASLPDTLGPMVPDDGLSKLRWSSGGTPFDLSQLGAQTIGKFCTNIGWEALVQGVVDLYWTYGDKLSVRTYWPRLIGKLVLEPYGLGDHVDANGAPTKYYSAQRSLFPIAIAPRNPHLDESSFYFSRSGRPWWVANSTFNAPGTQVAYPFWQSELDVGIYPQFPGQGIGGRDLGGGGIDPFTFGTQTPSSYGGGLFTANTPAGQYSLSDPVGTSSAAFGVELFSRLPAWLRSIIGDITPQFPYWPVMSPGQPAQNYDFSDGAGLDNSAVCGMLGWSGVESIVSIVSTEIATVVDGSQPVGSIDAVQMDSSIPALFGWIWDGSLGGYRPTVPSDGNPYLVRAFNPGDFKALVDGLRSAIGTGGAAIARVKTTTVTNPRFGIKAGRAIDVLFVFNYQAPRFWYSLEWEIRDGLRLQYPLVTFPYFNTVRDLNLTPQAVNLVADLMSWSLTSNESVVRSMFGTIT